MAGGRSFSDPNKAGATSFGMTSENFGYSAVRLKRVKKLQFGVVNPDELVSRLAPEDIFSDSYSKAKEVQYSMLLYLLLTCVSNRIHHLTMTSNNNRGNTLSRKH